MAWLGSSQIKQNVFISTSRAFFMCSMGPLVCEISYFLAWSNYLKQLEYRLFQLKTETNLVDFFFFKLKLNVQIFKLGSVMKN